MTRSESSIIPFLVRCHKVWLTPTARVPCSNAANIEECKTWTQSEFCTWQNSVRDKSLQKSIYSVPVQEMGKQCAKFGWPSLRDVGAVTKPRCETHWNMLGYPKLTNRSQPLVDRSSPYSENTWRRYCCLTIFYQIVDICLSCEDIARQSCAMVRRWQSLHPVFSASRMQHISDMHYKFALTPHHVWKYGRHPLSDCW